MGIISSLISSGTMGIVGAFGAEVVGFFKERQKNKHELDILAAQKELAAITANSAVALEAYKGLVSSYDTDKATFSSTPISGVDWVRGLTRPVLAALLAGTSCWVAIWAIRKVGIGSLLTEQIADHSVHQLFDLTAMCIAWFFGSRQIEKMRKN